MASQWDNFLQNLGEWRGSFASLDATGAVVESTPRSSPWSAAPKSAWCNSTTTAAPSATCC
jgi:hypothetical protein